MAKLTEWYEFENTKDQDAFIKDLDRNHDKWANYQIHDEHGVEVEFSFPNDFPKELKFIRTLAEYHNCEDNYQYKSR